MCRTLVVTADVVSRNKTGKGANLIFRGEQVTIARFSLLRDFQRASDTVSPTRPLSALPAYLIILKPACHVITRVYPVYKPADSGNYYVVVPLRPLVPFITGTSSSYSISVLTPGSAGVVGGGPVELPPLSWYFGRVRVWFAVPRRWSRWRRPSGAPTSYLVACQSPDSVRYSSVVVAISGSGKVRLRDISFFRFPRVLKLQ